MFTAETHFCYILKTYQEINILSSQNHHHHHTQGWSWSPGHLPDTWSLRRWNHFALSGRGLQAFRCLSIHELFQYMKLKIPVIHVFIYLFIDLLSGVKPEVVLRQFGEYFFEFCKRSGYHHMLRTLGGNLSEFTENLDALHSYLSLSYKVLAFTSVSLPPPSFLLEIYFIFPCLILAGDECTFFSSGKEPWWNHASPLLFWPQRTLSHCSWFIWNISFRNNNFELHYSHS